MLIVYFTLPDFICMHSGTMYVHFHLVIFFPAVPQNIFDVSQAVVVHKTQVEKQ